jgi:hypothetical protein
VKAGIWWVEALSETSMGFMLKHHHLYLCVYVGQIAKTAVNSLPGIRLEVFPLPAIFRQIRNSFPEVDE